MTTLPSDDLHESLSAAFDAAEAGTLESPREVAIEETPSDVDPIKVDAEARAARDDKGRFAPKTADTPADKEAIQARKPPSSWSKDHWERWGKLDAETQDYLDKREQDFAKGVSTYKNQWDQAAPVMQALQPYMPQIQQMGTRPEQYIQNLANADRMLRTGSPEQRLQVFAQLANASGIDLTALTGQQGNPQFGNMAQTVNALQQRLQTFESQQQQAEQQRLLGTIQSFAADKPHFEVLRQSMGQLLASGMALDLNTAYDKALRLNDDIWKQEQASQAKALADTRTAELNRKRAAGSSPRSASPTGAVAAGNANKGLREMLADSFDSHSSGRV